MNQETFSENFELLVDAPNGVQKLRELILQMAVQGKLVTQNQYDEPASILLEKIKNEKEQLVKEKKIKKSISLTSVESNEIPYNLPNSWKWVYLYQISNTVHYGYTASANHNLKEVRLLRITDIQKNKVNWDSVPGCEINSNNVDNYKLNDGDLLIARTGGTIGKSYLVDNLQICAVFASYLIRIVPSSSIQPKYLKLFLGSPLYWDQLYAKSMGTGQPNVNGTSLRSLIVPLPPLEEQKRIVTKVDQLMALYDELEARQQKKHEQRIRLNNAALDKLLTAPTPEEFAQHWQRVCDNFDLLYDAPETMGQLRQAILQLAVQGKLVAQDEGDEPAAGLLENIRAEKDRLINEKIIKKSTPLPPVNKDDFLFEIPESWEWVRFGETTVNRDGERIPVSKEDRNTLEKIYDYYGASGVIDKIDNYLFDKPLLLIGEDGANLINRSTPIAFIAKGKYWVNNHAHVLDGISLDFLRYLELYINATDLTPYVTGTAQPKMNQTKMNSIPTALPPLTEQKRIVAKVDQLMALCDELEAGLVQEQTDGGKLMEAVVHHVLAA